MYSAYTHTVKALVNHHRRGKCPLSLKSMVPPLNTWILLDIMLYGHEPYLSHILTHTDCTFHYSWVIYIYITRTCGVIWSRLHHWHLIALPPSSETQQIIVIYVLTCSDTVHAKCVRKKVWKCLWPVKRESEEIQWMTFTIHIHIWYNTGVVDSMDDCHTTCAYMI